MPGIALVGIQWGDEGKGKVTDLLAEHTDVVVRYQGGNNAGHTIVVEGERYALHLVPTGVLYPHCTPVIGPGVVVNPAVLIEEMDALSARGIDTTRLAALRQRAPDHAVPPGARSGDRTTARQEPTRYDEARHRSRVRGQGHAHRSARAGPARSEDLRDEA